MKRPIGVWIVFTYYTLGMFFVFLGLIGFALLVIEARGFGTTLTSSTGPTLFLSLVSTILNFTGAILLFLMRKQSLVFFIGAVASQVISVVVGMLIVPFTSAQIPALMLSLLFYIIPIAIIAYVWHLSKKGILS